MSVAQVIMRLRGQVAITGEKPGRSSHCDALLIVIIVICGECVVSLITLREDSLQLPQVIPVMNEVLDANEIW